MRTNRELTPAERAFIEAYLANGGNAKAAAIAAGYPAKQAAKRGYILVHRPIVKAALEYRNKLRQETVEGVLNAAIESGDRASGGIDVASLGDIAYDVKVRQEAHKEATQILTEAYLVASSSPSATG